MASLFHIPTLLATVLFPADTFSLSAVGYNFSRLITLSSLSLLSMRQFDYCHLIYFLMRRRILSPTFGHTLILSFNSLSQIANEWDEIRLVARNRAIKIHQYPTLIFPLMVSAIRYAQRGSLALICRGINDDKSYYYDYSVKKSDTILFLIYLAIFGLFGLLWA